jgi:hypothetical protein
VIQPDSMADDLGREAMAAVGVELRRHLVSFAGLPSRRQPRLSWQCRQG